MTATISDDTDTDPGGFPDDVPFGDDLSDLARIRADIVDAASPPVTLVHPTKPDYTLVFNAEIGSKLIGKYQRQATRAGRRDAALLNGLIVGGHCVRIDRAGAPLTDSGGRDIDFGNRELQQLLGVNTRADAARVFLGGDGYLAAMAGKVVQRAGYGADVEDADTEGPTGPGTGSG